MRSRQDSNQTRQSFLDSILNTRIGSVDAARRADMIAEIVAAARSSSTLAQRMVPGKLLRAGLQRRGR
jgi:hypothetical protein